MRTPIKISYWEIGRNTYIGVDQPANESSLCFIGNHPPVSMRRDEPGASVKPLVELPAPPDSCSAMEFVVISNSALTEHTQFGVRITDSVVIEDPTLSECGRFSVDPLQTYGLTPEQVQYLEALNYRAHVVSMKLDASPDILNGVINAFSHALSEMGILAQQDQARVRHMHE